MRNGLEGLAVSKTKDIMPWARRKLMQRINNKTKGKSAISLSLQQDGTPYPFNHVVETRTGRKYRVGMYNELKEEK